MFHKGTKYELNNREKCIRTKCAGIFKMKLYRTFLKFSHISLWKAACYYSIKKMSISTDFLFNLLNSAFLLIQLITRNQFHILNRRKCPSYIYKIYLLSLVVTQVKEILNSHNTWVYLPTHKLQLNNEDSNLILLLISYVEHEGRDQYL